MILKCSEKSGLRSFHCTNMYMIYIHISVCIIQIAGCGNPQKLHTRHNCSVKVVCKIFLSDVTKWKVEVSGQHVPEGVAWEPPTKARKIAQSVKEKISVARTYGTKPFDIVRTTLANVTAANVDTVFEDTAYQSMPMRVVDYIRNTDKRHQNQEARFYIFLEYVYQFYVCVLGDRLAVWIA